MMESSRAATPRVRTHVTFAGEFDSSKVSLLSTKGNGQVSRPSLYQLRSSNAVFVRRERPLPE